MEPGVLAVAVGVTPETVVKPGNERMSRLRFRSWRRMDFWMWSTVGDVIFTNVQEIRLVVPVLMVRRKLRRQLVELPDRSFNLNATAGGFSCGGNKVDASFPYGVKLLEELGYDQPEPVLAIVFATGSFDLLSIHRGEVVDNQPAGKKPPADFLLVAEEYLHLVRHVDWGRSAEPGGDDQG